MAGLPPDAGRPRVAIDPTDPIFRAAAARILRDSAPAQDDDLSPFRTSDDEAQSYIDEARQRLDPKSRPLEALEAGAFNAATLPARALFKVGGENSVDKLLKQNFPKEHAGIQARVDFRPVTPTEDFAYGAGKLGVEAATLFAPAGGIAEDILAGGVGTVGKLLGRIGPSTAAKVVGEDLMQKASQRILGKLAVKAAKGAGTFGIADAARHALESEAAGQGADWMGSLKAGGMGALTGGALGPAGLLDSAPLRIPAEAATMAGVSAAEQHRMPTMADVGSNVVLFTLMHGMGKLPEQLKGYGAQVEILKDAFQAGRKSAQGAKALADAINDMDPSVVDAFGRAVAHQDTPDVRAHVFGEIDPKLRKGLEDARSALNIARGREDSEGQLRAQHDVDHILKLIDRQNTTIVRDWNNAVDAARAARGGGPIANPEDPNQPGNVETMDVGAQRSQLEQEARSLEEEAQAGGTAPDQQRGVATRMEAIRKQIATLPPAPPEIRSEADLATDTIDPTMGAIEASNADRFHPTEPTQQDLRPNQMRRALGDQAAGLSPQEMADRLAQPAPPELSAPQPSRGVRPPRERGAPPLRRPGGLTYSDMPVSIAREDRPEVKRVLAERGIKGAKRKALMSGPDLWKRAAWEYYKATGKLPEGRFTHDNEANRWDMGNIDYIETSEKDVAPGLPMGKIVRSIPQEGHADVSREQAAGAPAEPVESPAVSEPKTVRGAPAPPPEAVQEGAGVSPGAESAVTRETEAGAPAPPKPDKAKLVPKRTKDGGVQWVAEPVVAGLKPGNNQATSGPKGTEDTGNVLVKDQPAARPTPHFKVGETVSHRGAVLVVDKVIESPDGFRYDLAGRKGVVERGVEEGPIMPAGRGEAPEKLAAIEPLRVPEKSASTVPAWVQDSVDQSAATADRLGLSDEIERLSAERLTAAQVAARIKDRVPAGEDPKQLVRAVRSKRGVPSMHDATEFEKWIAGRKVGDKNQPKSAPQEDQGSKETPSFVPKPSIDEILSGKHNTFSTQADYEKAKKTLRELATGLKINAGINPEALAALFKIGEYHLERLIRAGAAAGKDLYDQWASAIRLELEDVDATISDDRLRWMWENPDVKASVAAVTKEVANGPGRTGHEGEGEGHHEAARGGGAAPTPAEEPVGPQVSSGARARQPVGKPGDEPRGARGDRKPGGPPGEAVPGAPREPVVPKQLPRVREARTDWSYPRGTDLGFTKGERKTLNARVREILAKPADETTDEDRKVLASYSGLGGLGEGDVDERGTLFQHYTSVPVARMIWDKLEAMGWKGKRVLEPSVGSGVFIGTKPDGVKMTGIEMDDTAGEVARRLYPNQDIRIQPFETFTEGEGKFDASVGNPPFLESRGKLRFADEAKAYRKISTLHDFFIAKQIDQVKPGGVVANIVSTGFMDKQDRAARERVYGQADLVAAYRLPSGVFQKNTHFQGAVDLVIFRKRGAGEKPGDDSWLGTLPVGEAEGGRVPHLNEYFAGNPRRVLGALEAGYKVKHATQFGVKGALDEEAIKSVLADDVKLKPPPKDSGSVKEKPEPPKPVGERDASVKLGQHVMGKAGVLVATKDGMVPYVKETRTSPSPEKMAQVVTALDTADKVRNLMRDGAKGVSVAQAALKTQLDAWVKTYGNPHEDRRLMGALRADPRRGLLRSLIRPNGTYADIVTKPTVFSDKYASKKLDAGSFDAVAKEVERRDGVVTPDAFLALYKGSKFKTPDDVRRELEGNRHFNRTAGGWLSDDEYLYGNIRDRMKEAGALGEADQVAKLRDVLPPQETPGTFNFSLAAGWMDKQTAKDFVEASGLGSAHFYRNRWEIITDRGDTQRIDVPLGGVYADPEAIASLDLNWNKVVENRLNGKVFRPIPPSQKDGRWSPGMTEQQAKAANRLLKQVDLIFKNWAKAHGHDAAIVREFNEKFRSVRDKAYPQEIAADDFSTEKFKTILPWQAFAANMQLDKGRGINALNVGLGKTLSQILTAIVGKQQGLHQKAVVVVPGNVLLKWEDEFLSAFPNSKILNLGNLGKGLRRGDLLNSFANNDWDAGVVTYEGFRSIRMSPEKEAAFLDAKVKAMRAELESLPDQKKGKGKKGRSTRDVQVAIDKYEGRIAGLLAQEKGKELYFDDLGVDAALVDEAHNFRRVPYYGTGLAGELALGGGDAERALDMQMKLGHVLEANGRRGAYLATATPTPNTPIEIYTMIDHIAPDAWKAVGIDTVNDFLTSFAEIETVKGVDIDGDPKFKTKVSAYKNWNDLQTLVRRFVYMRNTKEVQAEFPEAKGFVEPKARIVTTMLDASPESELQIGQIRAELEAGPPKGADAKGWLLSLIGRARQVAAHPGLFDGSKENYRHESNKLDAIAKAVSDNYLELMRSPIPLPEDEPDHPGFNGHVVFLDSYGASAVADGKLKKNLHEHMRDRLVELGIPEKEIAIVNGQSNNGQDAKKRIQDQYNAGHLRVLIGSTPSMGEGMDLQNISTNLYHWDSQWNPGAIQQREGRVVRQGNKIDEVKVERFVQRGTFDAYFYDLLGQKQRWLSNLWTKDKPAHFANEADSGEETMSFEDVMAELAGTQDSRDFYQARAAQHRAEAEHGVASTELAVFAKQQSEVLADIKEREDKIEDYLRRRKSSENADAYESHIQGHKDAIAELSQTAARLKSQVAGTRASVDIYGANLAVAREALDRITKIREEIKKTGADYSSVLVKQQIEGWGGKPPAKLDVPAIADDFLSAVVKLKRDDLTGRAQDMVENFKKNGQGFLDTLTSEGTAGDTLRDLWQERYGEIPKDPNRVGPRSLGSASGPEMAKAERQHRRYLVEEAKRLGIGARIPTEAEAEARGNNRLAAAAGKPQKPRSHLAATAVPIPKAGIPVDDVERKLIEVDGPVDEERHGKLGQPHMPVEEWNGLTRGEKLVHLTRYVNSAADAKHLHNILGSQKYKVWTLPKDDQAALSVVVGQRLSGASLDEVSPPGLRPGIDRMERMAAGEAKEIEARARRTVFTLFPAEHNLRGLGIVEGQGGLREASLVSAHESQLWDQLAHTHLFRDPKGRLIKDKSRDDQIIAALQDNPEKDERGIDRPTVKIVDGEEVTPEMWHRARAKEYDFLFRQFADRQEIPIDRRQKFYFRHLIEAQLAFEPATPRDIINIHSYAKKTLESNYDAAEINAALGKGLKRNKALQIVGALTKERPASTMRGLKRVISAILAADESERIPKQLFIPHLQERKGDLPFHLSAQMGFKAYIPHAMRKIWIEPSILNAKEIIESLPDEGHSMGLWQSQRTYAESYIQANLGAPTASDRMMNAVMARFNDATHGRLLNAPVLWRLFKPNLVSRTARSMSQIQYLRLLGFALDSAATNLTQGVNTAAQVGLKRTLIGYMRLADPRFWKEMHQEKLLSEFRQVFSGPVAPWEQPLNVIEKVALMPFSIAEFVNRGAAFAAGLEDAKARGLSFENARNLGLGKVSDYLLMRQLKPSGVWDLAFGAPDAKRNFTTTPALTHARDVVLKTQFGYSRAESAPVMRYPSAKVALQFWNYTTRQNAFFLRGLGDAMRSGDKMQFVRFLALAGAMVTAPLWGGALGADMKNFWSVWSVFPRSFGPNANLLMMFYQAAMGRLAGDENKDVERKLERELYPPTGFRYVNKAIKYGPDSALPFRPIDEPAGRRSFARPTRPSRPEYERPGRR